MPSDQVASVADLFRSLTAVLEESATRQMCSGEEALQQSGLTMEAAVKAVEQAQDSFERSTVLNLLAVAQQHPEWGVKVFDDRPTLSHDEEVRGIVIFPLPLSTGFFRHGQTTTSFTLRSHTKSLYSG